MQYPLFSFRGASLLALCCGAALAVCLPSGVLADQGGVGDPGAGGARWGVGIAAISNQKAFKDIDRDTMAIPVIFFENRYVNVFGPFIDFKLPGVEFSEEQKLNFSLPLQYGLGGYDKDDIRDTPILNGMDRRKGGFWAGAKVEWENPWVNVTAQWLTDISGKSEGQRVSVGIGRNWVFGDSFLISPRLVAIWYDDKYVDYHYGVRTHEARIDRPAYSGEAAVNIEYGLRGIYRFDMKNSIFLDVGATSLASNIKDSPLIDSSTENQVLFGYQYQF